MRGFSLIAASAVALAVASPALAACKNAAGQSAKCPAKPVAKATPQAAKPAQPPKTCVIAGKAGPCKVQTQATDFKGHVGYRF